VPIALVQAGFLPLSPMGKLYKEVRPLLPHFSQSALRLVSYLLFLVAAGKSVQMVGA